MKKIIIVSGFILFVACGQSFADCVEAPKMIPPRTYSDGEKVVMLRCENKEAICYKWGGSISCFPKK